MQVGFIGAGNMASELRNGVLAFADSDEPPYWALFAEAWTDSAIRHGIPAARAATLVAETMAGTAAPLHQTDTLAVRRGVTSPGGSTARGLAALERGGVRGALAAAMDDAVGG